MIDWFVDWLVDLMYVIFLKFQVAWAIYGLSVITGA